MRTSTRNTCQYEGCDGEIDEPGLLCRRHWRAVPKPIRENYTWARKMVLKAVRAHEELP